MLKYVSAAGFAAFLQLAAAFPASSQTTELVSIDSFGVQANGQSFIASVSADGNVVAFFSIADNLVPGDTNGFADIFVHDRTTGVTERVSVGSAGAQGNGNSLSPTISADGNVVGFYSYADNLVEGDTNDHEDVFVHDRTTGVTERVSVDSNSAQANNRSYGPALSADGSVVAFHSEASNLVASDTNNAFDIFVHGRTTGVTERVSVDSAGAQAHRGSFAAGISADGNLVTFESDAYNLVSGDSNFRNDIFIHDRTTGMTERVSVDSAGAQANGPSNWSTISADGNVVTFESLADNLVAGDTNKRTDIFVHDRTTGVTERVSVDSFGEQANNFSNEPVLSGDGKVVAFFSRADNLVAADTNYTYDIFVHDRINGVTELVSVNSAGEQGNEISFRPAISADGNVIGFYSLADNLVVADTNSGSDVFIRDRGTVGLDSKGSFITGDGSVNSPAGAYVLDPDLVGTASFSFVAKNKKGQNTPVGNAELQFQAAALNFYSSSYDWLMVAGAQAIFTGDGTIEGDDGSYRFQLVATDGAVNGSGVDQFRLKIVDKATNSLIYDNQLYGVDAPEPTTAIASGSIVIHTKGKN